MTAGIALDDPAYFDRLAAIEAEHWWSIGLWRLASSWIGVAFRGRRELTALDVGSGAGGTLLRLGDRPEFASLIGIDPSPAALERAARRGVDRLALGSAMAIPIRGGSVDLATCFDVYQHLPTGGDRVASAEIRRVLRPGGFALIRSNGRGGFSTNSDEAPYDLGRLESAVEASGLEVVRSTYANCLPALASEFRGWIGSGSRLAGHPSGRGLRIAMPPPWQNRSMGLIARAEAFAAGSIGLKLPFGHSTMVLARNPETTT